MKVIVGLGNPGARYRNTRHNVGFLTLDAVAAAIGAKFDREKFHAMIATGQHAGERLLLVKPLTYMNQSGIAVAQATRNQISDLGDLLVVVDDVNLPLGRLRLRGEGSAGGHNGLKSITEHVGSQAYPRLRIGVGEKEMGADLSDHVLGTFKPEEKPLLAEAVERAAQAVLTFVGEGLARAMNGYNEGR